MKEYRYYPLRDGFSRKSRTLAGHEHKLYQQAPIFASWSLVSVMPLFKECWDTENIKSSFFFIQEGSPADSHTEKFKQRGRRSGYDNKHLLLDEEKFTGALQVKYKYLDTPKRTEKIRLWIKLYCDSLLFNETNGWAKFFLPQMMHLHAWIFSVSFTIKHSFIHAEENSVI